MMHNAFASTLIVAAALAYPGYGFAKLQLEVESASNRDGSAVRVKTITDEKRQLRKVWIYFRKPGQARMRLLTSHVSSIENNWPAGLTFIEDWDKNGTHEISITQECGAGSNCEGDLYHIAPGSGHLVPIFKGNLGYIHYMNGHLVEYSRAGCCAWGASVYAVSPDRLQIADKPAFHTYMGTLDEYNQKLLVNSQKAKTYWCKVRAKKPQSATSMCRRQLIKLE